MENNQNLPVSQPPDTLPLLEARKTKDEMNLAEFPFTLSSGKNIFKDGQLVKTLEIETEMLGHDNMPVAQKWSIIGSDKFGLPRAIDNDVYLALMSFAAAEGFRDRTISFSFYELIKRLGWGRSVKSYMRLRESIERLNATTIQTKNAFWDPVKKAYVDVGFHIISNYHIFHSHTPAVDDSQPTLFKSSITFDDVLWASIKHRNIQTLDYDYYISLSNQTSKRIYRYLSKFKFKYQSFFRVSLKRFAALIPLTREGEVKFYLSDIKRTIEPSLEELKNTGFIDSWEIAKFRHDRVITFYWTWNKTSKNSSLAFLSAELQKRGLTNHAQIDRLLTDCLNDPSRGLNCVYSQIEYFDWNKRYNPHLLSKNPVGFLVTSIKHNFPAPNNFVSPTTQQEYRVASDDQRAKIEETELRVKLNRGKIEELFDKYFSTLDPATIDSKFADYRDKFNLDYYNSPETQTTVFKAALKADYIRDKHPNLASFL